MLVETYNEPEVSDEQPIETEAVKALAERYMLEGQLKLIGMHTERFPFTPMSPHDLAVWKLLLPNASPVEKFDSEAIPLRVLQMYDLCREKNWFASLSIWYPEIGIDDPLLVGSNKHSRGWGEIHYPIARWGKVLLPWSELVKQATEIHRSAFATRIHEFEESIAALRRKFDRGLIPITQPLPYNNL